ncbi:amidohydrolase family protein [Labedaea rhizosphaerae]|uniref:Imidazolonepropionase-like amidohydrolase n=1 Tax=Labedaea rhizosphaerae TaxID=598644 RepID=A0A4R6SKF9_LABRH|nr:amidohydrolase family protein [Labedaea rhizosphaerae]TDQ01528.1 imidazolonepropionase-like amidohydrolase [Labedaea rhizosphaerae]
MTTFATDRPLRTAVRGARLFDGASVTSSSVVLFDGTRIAAVGQAVPADATVIDLPGTTLLPGLVDPHVHMAFDSSMDVVGALAARDDDAVRAAMVAFARTAALGGVTTVRDLGDRDFLSLAVRDTADPAMPTILTAGPPITSAGGHCHFLGGETVGVDGIRAAVRERAERGCDVIKVMASGGNLTPGSVQHLPQFAVPELRVAVEEAHRFNLPITAHAHGTQPVYDAVAAGLDSMEHASFITADGVDPAPPDLLATIAARGITLSMTLGTKPVPGGMLPGMAARMPLLVANLRAILAAGIQVVAGTDAGVAPTKPPDAVRWAPAQLVQVGVSPVDALRANTSVAADLCGIGDQKGRLAAGYDADILAVDGDPLADPAALHDLRAVFVRGTRVR